MSDCPGNGPTEFETCASRTVAFFVRNLEDAGLCGGEGLDISCYYKLPMLLIAAQREDLAQRVLAYIADRFLQPNGDFRDSPLRKSRTEVYGEYWAYINVWILREQNRLGMEDPRASGYLRRFESPEGLGYLTRDPGADTSRETDALTAANFGLLHLERAALRKGDSAPHELEMAVGTGDRLIEFYQEQRPTLDHGFFLRRDKGGRIIRQESLTHFVDRREPGQVYFMLGLPAAFLAHLHETTHEARFLKAAEDYLGFAASCGEQLVRGRWNQKVAWAASATYRQTRKPEHRTFAENIAHSFLARQEADGMWRDEKGALDYDQSAETAYWLLEIHRNLSRGSHDPCQPAK